jgi:hypothetical protein
LEPKALLEANVLDVAGDYARAPSWEVFRPVPKEATPIKVLWAASAGAYVKLREVLSQ